jgi:FdhE protein
MPNHTPRSLTNERIEKAIAKAEADLPALTHILEAFKHLLIETAAMRAELSENSAAPLPHVDKDTFHQGVPLADMDMFRVSAEELKIAAGRIAPAVSKGFPRIAEPVAAIATAVQEGAIDLEMAASHVLKSKPEELEKTASALSVPPEILRFVLGRAIRPFVETSAQRMAQAIEGLEWTRGYCPICGSWPALSVIKEKEGQRWLICSLCSHEWRFMRTQCPFCENQDPQRLEVFFTEDRESERAEVCHACKRYVVAIDMRERVDEVLMEVAPLMLVYLDILAQGEGFSPGAVTDWNVLD